MDFTCNGVEEHEVLKIGDLSPLPALRHVGGLEELTRGGQGNPPGKRTQMGVPFCHTRSKYVSVTTPQWTNRL